MSTLKFDVVIIGSGPAGNTAGIYLARAGISTAIISGTTIGGQLTTTAEVENWTGYPKPILGADLMSNIIEQSTNLGVKMIYNEVISVDFSSKPFKSILKNGNICESNYIIIATGASPKTIGVKGELEFRGKGVSTCAVCDGTFYKDKVVAVIGGGYSAGTEALYLARMCKKVFLIHRRDTFRMDNSMKLKCQNTKNIEIILNSTLLEISGNEKVNKIIINTNNKEREIFLDGVFIAVGLEPSTSIFSNTSLNLDEKKYIITQTDSGKTNINGVYAVGDVTNKPFKQGIIASAYGAISALEIQNDMEK